LDARKGRRSPAAGVCGCLLAGLAAACLAGGGGRHVDEGRRIAMAEAPQRRPATGPAASGGWRKFADNPVLGGALGTCFDVSVLREAGKYRMYFSWRPKQSVALVESRDGIGGWQRHPANPILAPERGAWDADACYKPFAIFDGEHRRWLLWYNGRRQRVEQIGLAIHEGEDLWRP